MAISGYSSHRSNNSRMIIFTVIAIAIIAVIIFFINPFGGKNKTEQTIEPNQIQPQKQQSPPIKVEVRHSQSLDFGSSSNATPAVTKAQTTTETTPYIGNIVTAAEGQVGDRILALLKDAQADIDAGRFISARATLNEILSMALTPSIRNNVKVQLAALADEWLFGRTILYGDELCSTYKVKPGDMLSQIAAKYNIPYQFIMTINNISNEKSLRAGMTLKVVQGPFHGIVYRSDFLLDLYLQNVYVKSYRIGLGKEGKDTPVGRWSVKIGGKLIKPIWTDPDTGEVFKADDPKYPLGSGWIALQGIDPRTRGITGIALHGTKDENSIGTRSSRGCIRLFNGELIEVFNMMEPGKSEIRIVE